jgi:hypothetical protein
MAISDRSRSDRRREAGPLLGGGNTAGAWESTVGVDPWNRDIEETS